MKTTGRQTENEILRRQNVITDNLARRAAEPAYRPERETRQVRVRRQAEQAAPLVGIRKGMDFFACAMLLAGLIIVAVSVIRLTKVRAASLELDRELTQLNNEYVNLVRMNDEAEQEIARSVDLNRVYEVAVGQYGMVFPRDNEVITINVRSEGYVRQYDDVAAAEKPEQTVFESLMEKLMR